MLYNIVKIIKSRKDFVYIQNNYDKKINGKSILLLIKNRSYNFPRFGYTVTKKIDKRAVVRNKIRRQLKEITRYFLKENNCDNFDYEIIAKKDFFNYPFSFIKNDIYELLKQFKRGCNG